MSPTPRLRSSPRDPARSLRATRPLLVSCALTLALASTALTLAGCQDRRIDLRNIEAAMRERYSRDAAVPITDVSCPEWVRTRAGETIDCQIAFEGGVVWTIALVQGEDGNTRWEPRGQAVFADDIERWLIERAAAEGQEAPAARCGARVYVLERDAHATCTVTAAGGEAQTQRVSVGEGGALRAEALAPAHGAPR